jgi:putative membrane protein
MTAPDGDPLPSGGSEPMRLHPLSPVLGVIAQLPQLAIPAIAALASPFGRVLWIIAALMVTFQVAQHLRTTYELDDHQLVVRSGLLNRTVRVVALDRVQETEVVRKLRHRITGLAAVRVAMATSGVGKSAIDLDAVSQVEAARLHAALELGRRRSAGDALPNDVPPPPAASLYSLPTRTLVVGGLTGASMLLVPAALFGTYSQLDSQRVDDAARSFARTVGPAAILVVGVVLVGVASVGTMFVRHYGLTVTRSGPDMRVERGLLERRASVIPLRRVQLVDVSATLLRRWLGLRSVDVGTAATLGNEGAGSVDNTLPVAEVADADALVDVVLGHPAPQAGIAHPAAARRRALVRYACRCTLCSVPLFALGVVSGVIGLVGGAVIGLRLGAVSARHRRHGFDADHIVVESGVLLWRRRLVATRRVQSTQITATPLQRRVGLVSVHFDIAGSPSRVTVRDVGTAQYPALLALVPACPSLHAV